MNDDDEEKMTTNGSTRADSAASPPFLLAQKVCEAMEQRDYSQLSSLLNISTHKNRGNNDGVAKDMSSPSSRCQQILQMFYSSIGRNDIHTNNNGNDTAVDNNSSESTLTIPMDIKSHLLLRALLHNYPTSSIHQNNCNNMSKNSLHVQLEAAIATVQSIQYSFSSQSSSFIQNNNTAANNSVSEEMAMIAEVRSFVANLRSGARSSNNFNDVSNNNADDGDGDEDKDENKIGNLTSTLECLLELGLVIVAPLLIHNGNNNNHHQQQQHQILKRINYKPIHQGNNNSNKNNNNNYTRREHSYLLPLELLPGIFATLDILEDVLVDLMSVREQQQRQQEDEEMEWEYRQFGW